MHTETILQALLQVCQCSGTRGEGISKVMDENKNLWSAVNSQPAGGYPPPIKAFPWFADCAENNALFFDNLLAAMRPTFPDVGKDPSGLAELRFQAPWPGRDYSARLMRFEVRDPADQRACLIRVLDVCKTLLARIDENRRMMELLVAYPNITHPGPQSWLEEFDIFFTDIGFELQWIECPGDVPRRWPQTERCEYCNGRGIEYGCASETGKQCTPCKGTGIFCDRDALMLSCLT
jgi:hypothetical protein